MEPSISTILLSRVIGLFLVLLAVLLLVRPAYYLEVFAGFVSQRLVRTVISLAEVIGALFIVTGHNVWTPLPAAIVTVIGWTALAEGCVYLFLPDSLLDPFIRTFNTRAWYAAGSILAAVIGIYLAAFGFGWLT